MIERKENKNKNKERFAEGIIIREEKDGEKGNKSHKTTFSHWVLYFYLDSQHCPFVASLAPCRLGILSAPSLLLLCPFLSCLVSEKTGCFYIILVLKSKFIFLCRFNQIIFFCHLQKLLNNSLCYFFLLK